MWRWENISKYFNFYSTRSHNTSAPKNIRKCFQIFENLIKIHKSLNLNIFIVSSLCLFLPTLDIDSIPRRLGYIEGKYWGGQGGSILVSGDNKETVYFSFCQIIDLYDGRGGIERLKIETISDNRMRLLISWLDFLPLCFSIFPQRFQFVIMTVSFIEVDRQGSWYNINKEKFSLTDSDIISLHIRCQVSFC